MPDALGFDFNAILQLSPVVLGMTEDSPDAVLLHLLDELVAAGRLSADLRDVARDTIHAREKNGSTALANGIAIPHGYLDAVPGPLAVLGIHARGVDCKSIDGQPTRIFILLLNHPDSRDHIRFLAAINRRLIIPEVRAALLVAQTREDVLRLLIG